METPTIIVQPINVDDEIQRTPMKFAVDIVIVDGISPFLLPYHESLQC